MVLACFFLCIPFAAAAPTETFPVGSPNTALVPGSPYNAQPRTFVRETALSSSSGKNTLKPKISDESGAYRDLVHSAAQKYGVSEYQMTVTIECETGGTWNPTMQSTYPNKRDGGRELSFGLVQIHLPDHPDVSRAQATNPEFAIDWMAREFKAGRQSEWSCYRKHF